MPIDLPESLTRLHKLIDNAATSPRTLVKHAIGLAIAGATIAGLFFGSSWASLGLSDNLHGVRSILWPMFSTLVASAATCAGIKEQLTNNLNFCGIAISKTFNKCCAALLALATLLVGIGLGTGNTSALPIYPGLARSRSTPRR